VGAALGIAQMSRIGVAGGNQTSLEIGGEGECARAGVLVGPSPPDLCGRRERTTVGAQHAARACLGVALGHASKAVPLVQSMRARHRLGGVQAERRSAREPRPRHAFGDECGADAPASGPRVHDEHPQGRLTRAGPAGKARAGKRQRGGAEDSGLVVALVGAGCAVIGP
jgi:hypothetical protein